MATSLEKSVGQQETGLLDKQTGRRETQKSEELMPQGWHIWVNTYSAVEEDAAFNSRPARNGQLHQSLEPLKLGCSALATGDQDKHTTST